MREDHGGAAVVAGEPLSPADAAKVLAKLPPLVTDPEQVKDFALRPGSLPGAAGGKDGPRVVPAAAVLHRAAGAGGRAARDPAPRTRGGTSRWRQELTVTFSRPMVPITSLTELTKYPPPVTVSPQPKGTWQWVGTQNALFKPEKRFPMATTFTVDVPAGARSIDGSALAAGVALDLPDPAAHRDPRGFLDPDRTSATRSSSSPSIRRSTRRRCWRRCT